MVMLQHHEKAVEGRKKILKELRHTIRGKEKNNATLDKDLEEMNVSVAERKHINEVNGEGRGRKKNQDTKETWFSSRNIIREWKMLKK